MLWLDWLNGYWRGERAGNLGCDNIADEILPAGLGGDNSVASIYAIYFQRACRVEPNSSLGIKTISLLS